jgi:hypothetical protein
MKSGVSFSQAEQDVKNVAAQIAKESASDHPSYTARLDGLRDAAVLEIRSGLFCSPDRLLAPERAYPVLPLALHGAACDALLPRWRARPWAVGSV